MDNPLNKRLNALRDRVEEVRELLSLAFLEGDVEAVIEVLSELGFFTAPASTRFHGNHEGGLCDHSIMVTKELLRQTKCLGLEWEDRRSPVVVGLFHDLCKCDNYITLPDGNYDYNKDQTLNGHGDKSVIVAAKAMSVLKDDSPFLTDEEVHCIRWHMGAYDAKENWGTLNNAIKKYPNVLFSAGADNYVAQVLEQQE